MGKKQKRLTELNLMCIIWLIWIGYEAVTSPAITELGKTCAIGAIVGGLIGGVIGMKMNQDVIKKSDEILAQIKELQQER